MIYDQLRLSTYILKSIRLKIIVKLTSFDYKALNLVTGCTTTTTKEHVALMEGEIKLELIFLFNLN